MAAANGFHQPVMEIGLRQILLKGTPATIPQQGSRSVPVHRHNRQGMPRKAKGEKRNVDGKADGQYHLGVCPHSGRRKAETSESIAVQKVADQNDAPECHPSVGKGVLPAPDVSYNARINQHDFQGRIDRRPGVRNARGFKFAN